MYYKKCLPTQNCKKKILNKKVLIIIFTFKNLHFLVLGISKSVSFVYFCFNVKIKLFIQTHNNICTKLHSCNSNNRIDLYIIMCIDNMYVYIT